MERTKLITSLGAEASVGSQLIPLVAFIDSQEKDDGNELFL
jgi:hypothetical protein